MRREARPARAATWFLPEPVPMPTTTCFCPTSANWPVMRQDAEAAAAGCRNNPSCLASQRAAAKLSSSATAQPRPPVSRTMRTTSSPARGNGWVMPVAREVERPHWKRLFVVLTGTDEPSLDELLAALPVDEDLDTHAGGWPHAEKRPQGARIAPKRQGQDRLSLPIRRTELRCYLGSTARPQGCPERVSAGYRGRGSVAHIAPPTRPPVTRCR